MDKNRKQGLWVLIALMVVTFGTYTLYQAQAKGRGLTALKPPTLPALPPWAALPDPLQALAPHAQPTDAAHGELRISTALDRGAVLEHGDGVVRVEVTLAAPGRAGVERVPTDIAVVVDRSGSMGGQKLEYAKQALRELIARLGKDDRFALVAYDDAADVRVHLSLASLEHKPGFLSEVERLEVGGSTNMSAGLDLALSEIQAGRAPGRAARLLLLSDGLANAGDASPSGLEQRASRALRSEVVLSTIGIGSDFDESLMSSLARVGSGAFYYLAKLEVLPQFLSAELKTATETYAEGATLEFELGPGVELTSASGGSLGQRDRHASIALGTLYANHERKLWLTLRVPTDRLQDRELGALSLSYRYDGKAFRVQADALPKVACVTDVADFRSRIVKPLWERAVLEDDVTHAEQQLGDAIKTGSAADVDQAVQGADQQRELANALGSQVVLDRLSQLQSSASAAKVAQKAAPELRNDASKRQTAKAYSLRNADAFINSDPRAGY